MWRITAVLACACTALALAGGASSTTFGVADDAGKFICLNEGNQPRFHQPQFDESGKGISGYVQEQAMAACYDAVKAVDPNITVIAFGLSPRGNDDFEASSNVSHSPIRFLEEVGEAYRASGRTKPIADEVSIHCYPHLTP